MKLQIKEGDVVVGLRSGEKYTVVTASIKSNQGENSSLVKRVRDDTYFFFNLDDNCFKKVPKIKKKEFWQVVWQNRDEIKCLMIAVDHRPTEKDVRTYMTGDKILKIEKVTVEYEVAD